MVRTAVAHAVLNTAPKLVSALQSETQLAAAAVEMLRPAVCFMLVGHLELLQRCYR